VGGPLAAPLGVAEPPGRVTKYARTAGSSGLVRCRASLDPTWVALRLSSGTKTCMSPCTRVWQARYRLSRSCSVLTRTKHLPHVPLPPQEVSISMPARRATVRRSSPAEACALRPRGSKVTEKLIGSAWSVVGPPLGRRSGLYFTPRRVASSGDCCLSSAKSEYWVSMLKLATSWENSRLTPK
jgi:hypothetical protein